jgi:AcrR family transcriptional regulator
MLSTREQIVSYGLGIASAHGLKSLSLGDAARDLDLPRSGVFAHFETLEQLQLAVLEEAGQTFTREVVVAGEAVPAGEARVRALFTRWLQWSRSPRLKGGCPFVHASAESDSLAGPVRARLTEYLAAWSAALRKAIEACKPAAFRADLDADQLVFELHGLYLSHHFWHWSMRDPTASQRTLKAFERLLEASRR